MDKQDLQDQVKKLITQNRTDEALKVLSGVQLSKVDKELIILNSQYNRIKEELSLNIISREEGERRINKINFALLDLSHKINSKSEELSFGNNSSSSTSNKVSFDKKYLLILLIPLLGLIGYLGYNDGKNESASANDSSSTTEPAEVDPAKKHKEVLSRIHKDPALVAHYPFDEKQANTSKGSLNGHIESEEIKAVKNRKGEVGKALSFPGGDARVRLGELLNIHSKDFSIAFWVNPKQNDSGFIFGQFNYQTKPENRKCLHCLGLCNHCLYLTKGSIAYDEYPPDGKSQRIENESKNQIPLDKWTHVVFTRQEYKGEIFLYINGAVVAEAVETETFKGTSGSPNLSWIGGRFRAELIEADFFQGNLDEFYVFNRAINQEEVQALYHSPN
ncbi:MAG: LamG-like jellyroll fold domain-containing protein [Saprospiraceae bacterium]